MTQAPCKVGILSNAQAGRNKREGLGAIEAAVAAHPGVLHARPDDVEGVSGALRGFAEAGVGVVIINGGDGTIQTVLTALLARRPFAELPYVGIFPGGTTNLIAEDVGLRGRPKSALSRLLRCAAAGGIEKLATERAIIRMIPATGVAPVYGAFFGAGAISRGIEYCRETVDATGRRRSNAAFLGAILGLGLPWRSEGRRRIWHGEAMGLVTDGEAVPGQEYLLAMVTTLDKFPLGSRPYWGKGPGGLRFSSVAYPTQRFARYALGMMFGGPNRSLPEPAFVSRNAETVFLDLWSAFTLDGEMFEPVPGDPVRLEVGGRIRFVQ